MSTVLYQPTGITIDCLVQAQSIPNMTVAVDAGVVIINGSVAAVAGGNVTITAADATTDRTDAIVADTTGALSCIAGPIQDGFNAQPPDTTGYALLAYVYVVNQSSPSYTGTILSTAITDERTVINLPQPAWSFIYTYDNVNTGNADPGAGKFRFDSTTSASIAHCYISYTAANEYGFGGVQFAAGMAKVLSFGNTVYDYYLIFRDRSDAGIFWVGHVTQAGSIGHTNYVDLAITQVTKTTALNTTGLSTAPLDVTVEILQIIPATTTPAGTLIKRTVHTTGTAATHTFDASATQARITAVGQGGGGGGASTNSGTNVGSAGGGGGGGGTADVLVTVTGGGTATYTVGTANGGGGTGGTTGGNGTDGSDSTITVGATTYTGSGGKGGTGGGTGGASLAIFAPGDGGTATNGDLNMHGQPGDEALRIAAALVVSGDGGPSMYGGGGVSVTQSAQGATAGNNGGQYGSGGSGAAAVRAAGGNQAAAGGNGANGVIIVEEYT